MKKFVLIAAIWGFMQSLQAQQLPSATEQQLENLTEATDEETEDDSYLQLLQYYQSHPLNINTASAEDLQLFKLLTPLQIQSLIQYRQLFQNLISVYELQAVPLWDLTTIRKIRPYITINKTLRNLGSRFTDGEHTVLLRETRLIEKQKGFDKSLPTHFSGDPNHLLLRYKYQYKNEMQYGFLGEKDAGEAFFKSSQRSGFDFYSFHFFARHLGIIKAIAIGDFTVNMGQGLMQWQALAFKKSSEPLAVVRQSPTLMPYQSAGEFYFNRGAGITLQKGIWETTLFGSLHRISANVVSDSMSNYFTSFSTSGLHRTASELEDKNSVQQASFGGSVKLRLNRFHVGINTVHYHFSTPLQKRDELYNIYAISGSNWHNISADYNFVYKNVYFFGEAARDRRGHLAFVNGLIASMDPKIDLAIVQRRISPQYQALYGNAFTENIAPTNERGFYLGLTIRPHVAWRINSYADFFKFPWLKYNVDAPSSGHEYLLQLTYQPNKRLEVYARFRQEQKALNEYTGDSVMHFAEPKNRQNLRLNFSYQLNPSFALKARSEVMLFDLKSSDAEKGFLVYVEGIYGGLKKLKAAVRLQYFNADGYNSRIYAYESDVLYSYSVPAFFNRGFRYYFNLQYHAFKRLSLWFRWSQTFYKSGAPIGTGLTSIDGNTRSEVKCQASYRL